MQNVGVTGMKIVFHTTKLNKRFVRRVIDNTLLHIGKPPNWEDWDIIIYSTKDTPLFDFQGYKSTSGRKLNANIPSGITGDYIIRLFLHDSTNEFEQRENADRIQHELCHARLFGTTHFVSAVHNTVRRFYVKFWYWRKFWWKKTQLSIIDIRPFL